MPTSATAILSIGDVAHQAGVGPSRIRYYESIGILPVPERGSGKRRYRADMLRRLTVITAAQRIGFTLDEIRELLGPGRRPAHERLRTLAIHKLPEIDELIERATTIRQLLITCAGCECDSLNECRILDESLNSSLSAIPLARPPGCAEPGLTAVDPRTEPARLTNCEPSPSPSSGTPRHSAGQPAHHVSASQKRWTSGRFRGSDQGVPIRDLDVAIRERQSNTGAWHSLHSIT